MQKHTPNNDDVFSKMQRMILDGHFANGEKLPSERALMERFSVGRNVVRESIAALSKIGLLETKPRHRPIVTYTGQETAIDTVEGFLRHFLSDKTGFEHLFNSRLFIEAALCRHAALHARKEDIHKLRAALEKNKQAIHNSIEFYRTDVLFHKILYEIPRNPVFTTIQKAYVSWLVRHWAQMERGNELNALTFSGHEAIFNAIVERDPDAAEKALQDHLRIAWEQVKSTFPIDR